MAVIKIVPFPGPKGDPGEGSNIFSIDTSNSRTGTGEVLQFTDPLYQSIVTGVSPTTSSPTANRIVVAGQDGVAGTSYDGEGGDIYLWAGIGGGENGSGGDIKIDGGNAAINGSGGYVKIRGGYSENSYGGRIDIDAGDSNTSGGGNINLRAGSNSTDTESYGGSINIVGGYSANAQGGGSVSLSTYQGGKITVSGDGGEFLNDPTIPNNQIATIGDIQSGTTGDITFSGVQMIGAGTASGDGSNNGTIQLVPDSDLYASDQYLIIDPTIPNHIHIRAGGTQDESNAQLMLGSERTKVHISDSYREVAITTKPTRIENSYLNTNEVSNTTFTTTGFVPNIQYGYTVNVGGTDFVVDSASYAEGVLTATAGGAVFTAGQTYTFIYESPYDNYWVFDSDGGFYGPAMGGIRVTGLEGIGGYPLYIGSNDGIVLSGNSGEFLNDSSFPNNQIATIGDLPTGATGSFTSQDGKTITVTNGIITGIEAT